MRFATPWRCWFLARFAGKNNDRGIAPLPAADDGSCDTVVWDDRRSESARASGSELIEQHVHESALQLFRVHLHGNGRVGCAHEAPRRRQVRFGGTSSCRSAFSAEDWRERRSRRGPLRPDHRVDEDRNVVDAHPRCLLSDNAARLLSDFQHLIHDGALQVRANGQKAQ